MADVWDVVSQFSFSGRLEAAESYGRGHINDTYLISCQAEHGSSRRYILQRINRYVFKDPPGVMENIDRVTRHLRAKIEATGGDPRRETLNLVETVDGRQFFQDQDGEFWRAFLFIEGAHTSEIAQTQQQTYQAAWAFGNFQLQLADFPTSQLHETIPNFHNTPLRFQAFVEVAERDPFNRASSVREEIRFLERHEGETHFLVDRIEKGILPVRVTHNDTKLNNVMLDDRTGRAVCILDLDTVMPGLTLYDFGDAVRSAAALVAEDAPDSSQAGISIETFDNLAHGYLDAARSFLIASEVELLPFSARLITLEQALRFLADYLAGDVYYKVHRPGHNLDRARTQIGMVRDMETGLKREKMDLIIAGYR